MKSCIMTLSVVFSVLVLAKFNLPGVTPLVLKDSAGVGVGPDIFDELLKSSKVSFKASTEEGDGKQLLLVFLSRNCIYYRAVLDSGFNQRNVMQNR